MNFNQDIADGADILLCELQQKDVIEMTDVVLHNLGKDYPKETKQHHRAFFWEMLKQLTV